jgi:amino acid permease
MAEFDPKRAQQVIETVVWPAAAGNVAWALLSLLLQAESSRVWWCGQALSIAFLVVLTAYLFLACYRGLPTSDGSRAPKPLGVIFDVFLAANVALLAISISNGAPTLWGDARPDQWLVIGVFCIAFIGHATFSWVAAQGEHKRREEENISLALSIVYLAAISAFVFFALHACRVGTVLTFALTILLWVLLRGRFVKWPPSMVNRARTSICNRWKGLASHKSPQSEAEFIGDPETNGIKKEAALQSSPPAGNSIDRG